MKFYIVIAILAIVLCRLFASNNKPDPPSETNSFNEGCKWWFILNDWDRNDP